MALRERVIRPVLLDGTPRPSRGRRTDTAKVRNAFTEVGYPLTPREQTDVISFIVDNAARMWMLTRDKDTVGMQQFHDKSVEEALAQSPLNTRDDVRETLYFIARFADAATAFEKFGLDDPITTILIASDPRFEDGEVTKFYSSTVGYEHKRRGPERRMLPEEIPYYV